MTTMEAIYKDGVLRPARPLKLADQFYYDNRAEMEADMVADDQSTVRVSLI